MICPTCGRANEARGDVCDLCGTTVQMKLKYDVEECQERGMTFAVPLKVTIRLVVWNKDPETGRQDDSRHQGAGGLLRRHPADGRSRHVHHQRHRARHRQPVAPLAGRVLPHGRQERSTSRRSFRTAARGWSSSTTRRTCCTSASTASASSWRRSSCGPSGLRGAHEILRTFYTVEELLTEGRQASSGRCPTRSSAAGPATELPIPGSDLALHPGQEDPQGSGRGAEEGRRRGRRAGRDRARGRVRRVAT